MVSGLAQLFLPTHLLAVVALGLLGGQAQRLTITLAAFALGLLAGSVAIATAIRETQSALMLLALAAIMGSIVVVARPVPVWTHGALALAAGLALALNAPPQALTIAGAIASQFGTALAALGTLAIVIIIAMKAERPWQQIGLRVVGSWIAASAILVLALRLTR
jgi:hypothetical protein